MQFHHQDHKIVMFYVCFKKFATWFRIVIMEFSKSFDTIYIYIYIYIEREIFFYGYVIIILLVQEMLAQWLEFHFVISRDRDWIPPETIVIWLLVPLVLNVVKTQERRSLNWVLNYLFANSVFPKSFLRIR